MLNSDGDVYPSDIMYRRSPSQFMMKNSSTARNKCAINHTTPYTMDIPKAYETRFRITTLN